MMKKGLLMLLLWLTGGFVLQAQSVSMNFPHFAGKSYDFIIFQGDKQITLYQGTIPSDGKFTLTIPKEYIPYTGMSRWLITGTREGGGLDMYIPGKDFSVSCTEADPTEKNVIYQNNNGNKELNELYRKQEKILLQYETMLQAAKVFSKADKNYSVFVKELQDQIRSYAAFQAELRRKSDYISQFLQIVNITRGTAPLLSEKEEDKAESIARYIVNEMDWNYLYTSGHWSSIIDAWVSIHTRVLKNPQGFASDVEKLSSKIKSPELYTDFAGRTAYYLTQQKEEDYIRAIAPVVTASGKIKEYNGSLASYLTTEKMIK
ncbi:alkyl hydroperoxide reductase [Elizabethkingia sp. HX WHF]|uniref:alkyl hydroperoxide reductase n=1 Tax=Elizabethkingia TaxID=308865 RepID=UPI0020123A8E|nr:MULTISPECIES: alkyl hydroperoxide reductase [Elizabethkingia]MCL1638919.1 alkyl hydroperoxide reductase [Elizabethkingia bruuniana]MDX8562971.1 alkyl hydroperoxide reductase [Elizabethkingia sp. HX WHF]